MGTKKMVKVQRYVLHCIFFEVFAFHALFASSAWCCRYHRGILPVTCSRINLTHTAQKCRIYYEDEIRSLMPAGKHLHWTGGRCPT